MNASLGSYSELTLLTVAASGSLTLRFANLPYFGSDAGKVFKTVGPDGQFEGWSVGGCTLQVSWNYSLQGGKNLCFFDSPDPHYLTDTAIVSGVGTATWNRGPFWGIQWVCGQSGYPDCYTYEGDFQVTATPFAADMQLTANHTLVTPGQTVIFTAAVQPAAIGQIAMPFRVTSWTWSPDSGSAVGPICSGQTTCSLAITSSGIMTANGVANGMQTSKQKRVSACPPTGDPKLDDPDFLKKLRDELAASGTGNGRVERGGWADLAGGEWTFGHSIVPGSATDCSVTISLPSGAVVMWHTHPNNWKSDVYYTCPELVKTPGDSVTAGMQPGPSPADSSSFVGAQGSNPGIEEYIIEADGTIWKQDPTHIGSGAEKFVPDGSPNKCLSKVP